MPTSEASISSPCVRRSFRLFGSFRSSPNMFHMPVTVLTPRSPMMPAPTAAWTLRLVSTFPGVL